VRESAAAALGKIKEKKAVDPLIAILRTDSDDYARSASAWALANIGDDRAKEPFLMVLRDKNTEVRKYAITGLEILKCVEAVEPLIEFLNDKNQTIRMYAIHALKEIKDRKSNKTVNRIIKR